MDNVSLPLGFGDLDFTEWLRGLVAAFISGGASAVTSGITVSAMDPRDYSFGGRKIYALMFTMFAVNGLLGAAMFLRSKPVPDHKTHTVVEKTVTTDDPHQTVKTRVEMTTTPADQPPTKG